MKAKSNTKSVALLSFFTIIIVFPVFWMISNSLKSNVEIFTIPTVIFPEIPQYSTYENLFKSVRVLRYFVNSYFIGIVVAVFSLLLGSMAGYGFSRYKFKGSTVMNLFTIVSQMIPPVTLMIPYFAIIVKLRLYDTHLGLILTYMSFALPYSILMMTGYYNTISKELDEAARIDGCSPFRTFLQVVTPAAIPGMISTAVYTFLLAWNEFVFALVLTRSTEMRTVPVGISLMIGELNTDWSGMMAMSVMGSVPVLILYLILQRYFMSGLTAGSVKG